MTKFKTANQTAEFYNEQAEQYIANNAVMFPTLKTLADEALELLAPGSHIFDVGCAHGRDMAYFESLGFQTTGIDVSRELISHAKDKVHGDVFEMDMRNLSFSDNNFDLIWSIASVLHLPKTESPGIFAEFKRVLNDNGVLIISLKIGNGEAWEDNGSMQGAGKRFFAYYQPHELVALLANAGFEIFDTDIVKGKADTWITIKARG